MRKPPDASDPTKLPYSLTHYLYTYTQFLIVFALKRICIYVCKYYYARAKNAKSRLWGNLIKYRMIRPI